MPARDDEDDDRPPWGTLMWMGLFCGVALGAVIVLLFRDRRSGGQLGAPINIWNVGGGYPALNGQAPMMPMMLPSSELTLPQAAATLLDGATDPGLKQKLATVTLNAGASNRLVRATGGRRWSVEIRTIGPPGSYGIFSTEPDQDTGATVGANAIALPAGDRHIIELEPGDYLFGRGSTNGVVVSYSARQLA